MYMNDMDIVYSGWEMELCHDFERDGDEVLVQEIRECLELSEWKE